MASRLDLDKSDSLTFETDRNGIIRSIGENNWNLFAKENGAPELRADTVVGRSLFDFIEGTRLRNHIRSVMEQIAQDPNWVWVLPFRCDTPDRKRVIRQSVKPVYWENQCTGFLFQSVDQYSQQRPPLGIYDFQKLRNLGTMDCHLPIIAMCSWCQKVQRDAGEDDWISAEDYYVSGGRSEVRISHGICNQCLNNMEKPFLNKT